MLVLSRRNHESVVVGGKYGLTVTVMEVKGGKVRLGFDVHPTVSVHRSEVFDRISQEQSRLAQPMLTAGNKLIM